MFKIIYNHLLSQTINKPSVSSKINKWSLSKFDLNINRFESVLMFYKKELLNSNTNHKKTITYSISYLLETLYTLICLLGLVIISFYFIISFLFFIKTETLMTSIKFSLLFLIKNTIVFQFITLTLSIFIIYTLLIKNKKYLLTRYNLIVKD